MTSISTEQLQAHRKDGKRLVLRDAVLTGADLQGADLQGADLRGALGLPIAADAQERLRAVATAALQPNALEMETWHACETTHCMAGWAIHLAGEPGEIMEKMLGPEVTGLLLLGSEAHRYFYKSNKEARQFLQGVIEND